MLLKTGAFDLSSINFNDMDPKPSIRSTSLKKNIRGIYEIMFTAGYNVEEKDIVFTLNILNPGTIASANFEVFIIN